MGKIFGAYYRKMQNTGATPTKSLALLEHLPHLLYTAYDLLHKCCQHIHGKEVEPRIWQNERVCIVCWRHFLACCFFVYICLHLFSHETRRKKWKQVSWIIFAYPSAISCLFVVRLFIPRFFNFYSRNLLLSDSLFNIKIVHTFWDIKIIGKQWAMKKIKLQKINNPAMRSKKEAKKRSRVAHFLFEFLITFLGRRSEWKIWL